jgi:hypothetical protein
LRYFSCSSAGRGERHSADELLSLFIISSSPTISVFVNSRRLTHGTAIRAFQAARLDPKCAVAHWGIAVPTGDELLFALLAISS